jgi:hypothetical protein
MAAPTPNDKVAKLKVYAEGLKQRLAGTLNKDLRYVLEIDLEKTERKIAKLI